MTKAFSQSFPLTKEFLFLTKRINLVAFVLLKKSHTVITPAGTTLNTGDIEIKVFQGEDRVRRKGGGQSPGQYTAIAFLTEITRAFTFQVGDATG